MNIIQAFGQVYDVPTSNGQLEPSVPQLDDESWLLIRAQVDGRVACEIDPSMHNNVPYLRAYLQGAAASLNAQLVLPTRLVEAEATILLEWAQYTAATVRRLRKLNEEMAQVDEPWAK